MPDKFFKVVDNITSEIIVDTKITNYNLTLPLKHYYSDFLSFICESSSKLNLPLDFYVTINNNICILGNEYLQCFPKSVKHRFDIYQLTKNPLHNGFFVNETDLISIVQGIDKIGFKLFGEGYYLWEYIFEGVRAKNYANRPNRGNSVFLFDNLGDCEYYIQEHKNGGQICEVQLIHTQLLFKADMNIIDTIPSSFTFKQAQEAADSYWSAQSTDKPVFEYLFEGTCKLKPVSV